MLIVGLDRLIVDVECAESARDLLDVCATEIVARFINRLIVVAPLSSSPLSILSVAQTGKVDSAKGVVWRCRSSLSLLIQRSQLSM